MDCLWLLVWWLKRISLPEIKEHPWFLKNLPKEIIESERKAKDKAGKEEGSQSVEEIMRIIQEAMTAGQGSKGVLGQVGEGGGGSMDGEDDIDESEIDVSGDYAEH